MFSRVTLLLYWGGGVVETDEGIAYDVLHKRSIVVSNTITYEALLSKLNGNGHIAKEGSISRMVCRWPSIVRPRHPVVYSPLVIDDDDAVESMLQIVQDGVFRHVDLYLEFTRNGSENLTREHDVSRLGTFSSMVSEVTEYATSQPSLEIPTSGESSMQNHESHIYEAPTYNAPSDKASNAAEVDTLNPSFVPSSQVNTREYLENTGLSHQDDDVYATFGTCLNENTSYDELLDDSDALFDSCEDVETGDERSMQEPNVGQSVRMHEPMSEIFTKIDMDAIDAPYDDGTRSYLLGSEWDPLTHEPTVGLLFPNKASVIRAIQIYSVARNRQCLTKESKKHTLLFICLKLDEEKCSWRLRATRKKSRGNQWEISKYKGPHMCLYMVEGSDHMQMTCKFVAHIIEQQVKVNPELSIAEIVLAVKSRSINITKRKASIAKNLAIQSVFGNWEESYKELPRFKIAMQHYNPGTVVVYDSVNTTTVGFVQFKYMFWAMSGSIAGFSHCRPIVAIDGTFLKGKYKGVLLIANSVDSNNQIFPLAFAIVDTESEASWGFFLRCLRTHVAKERLGICLISDRSNSIKAAVNKSRNGWANDPYGVFHCHCIRHYKANFVKKFKNEMLGDLMMQAAKKNQVRKFQRVMEAIKAIDEAAEKWLRTECPLEKWTLSHDKGRRHGQLTSNLVESLNSVLKGPRALPIMALVQCIFYKISEFFAYRYKKAFIAFEKSEMSVTPSVYEQISRWQKKAATHTLQAHHLQEGIYTILTQRRPRGGGNIQSVQLSQRYCSCGKWAVYQVPCSHVIAVCQTLGYDWKQYVGDELYVRTWKKVYEHTVMPIEHEDYWPLYTGPLYSPNQSLRRGKGRPKKNRIASDMDLIARKRKRVGGNGTSSTS